jgi:hypothetical protein
MERSKSRVPDKYCGYKNIKTKKKIKKDYSKIFKWFRCGLKTFQNLIKTNRRVNNIKPSKTLNGQVFEMSRLHWIYYCYCFVWQNL